MINEEQKHKILHGKTLESILTELEKTLGWQAMADKIPIRCFQFEPSVKSSLAFLRKTNGLVKK